MKCSKSSLAKNVIVTPSLIIRWQFESNQKLCVVLRLDRQLELFLLKSVGEHGAVIIIRYNITLAH